MLEENSNHEEETDEEKIDLFDDSTLKPTEGDGTDNEGIQDEFLARINQETGKNFKSVEDWKKSTTNLENALKTRGRQKDSTPIIGKLVEDVFFTSHPEAKDYWENVTKEAQTLKRDPFELYLSSNLLQREAKEKHEEQQGKEYAKNNMGVPSNQIGVSPKTEEKNPFDRDYPSGFAIAKK